MIARIETILPATAERVWLLLLKRDTFRYITRGAISFDGIERWPQQFAAGTTLTTRMRLFGVVPLWSHRLEVVRVDAQARELLSHEHGGLVRRWNHRIKVSERVGQQAHYIDEIDIDAGLLTPVIWLFAHLFYRYRQMRWRYLAHRLSAHK